MGSVLCFTKDERSQNIRKIKLDKKTFKMPPNNEAIVMKSKPEKSEIKPKKYSRTEEVFSIRRKLEKITKSADKSGLIIDHGQAFDLLQRLGEIDINFRILKETMIGSTVHGLKKSSTDEEIISKSKSLIKAWKKFVPTTNSDTKERSSSPKPNSPKPSETTDSSTEKIRKGTNKSSN